MSTPVNMRRGFALVIATIILVIGFVVAGAVGAANATGNHEDVCVPQDAWTETVPGTPGSDAVTEIVHHEAVTVDHEAVTHKEWKYAKHGGHGFLWADNDTYKYINKHGEGTNDKPRHGEFYERTQHTKTVTDVEAWTETITEAWEETVIVTPAVPATPDTYIEHDAVVCEPEPVDVCLNIDGIQESIPEGMEAGPANEYGPTCVEADKANPSEEEVVDKPVSEKPEVLASTGDESWIAAALAGGLMLLGSGGMLIARRLGA